MNIVYYIPVNVYVPIPYWVKVAICAGNVGTLACGIGLMLIGLSMVLRSRR